MEGLDLSKVINPCEMMKLQREERRWSQRNQNKTIPEDLAGAKDKNESANKKRSLSGNTMLTSNSFSVLDDDDLVDRIVNMGVPVSKTNYDTVDMLKKLELARISLNAKNLNSSDHNKEDEIQQSDEIELSVENPELVEWKDDESIASDDIVVITPKRSRRPPKRLSLSMKQKNKPTKKKGTNKAKPCDSSQSNSVVKGIPDPPKTYSTQKYTSVIK